MSKSLWQSWTGESPLELNAADSDEMPPALPPRTRMLFGLAFAATGFAGLALEAQMRPSEDPSPRNPAPEDRRVD